MQSGVIPAIRGWSIRWMPPEPARLWSVILPYEWDGPVVRTGRPAFDLPEWPPPVTPRPEVGFHACAPEHAYDLLRQYTALECVGAVSLFGKVIEHELGFRSEVVRVDRLWVVRGLLDRRKRSRVRKIVRALDRQYRCDASVVDDLREATRACRQHLASSPRR